MASFQNGKHGSELKKEIKYFLLLGCAALIYLLFKLFSPREFDWTITFNVRDKNPFGGYVLYALIDDLFPGSSVHHSYKTIYELYDSVNAPVNFLSVSTHFNADEEDMQTLLRNVEEGGNAFISAQYIGGILSDTLQMETSDYYFDGQGFSVYMNQNDTASLSFVNRGADTSRAYLYPRNNIHQYVKSFDSTRCTVVAVNDLGLPVTIRAKWGKGSVVVNTTPLAFSNAYVLHGDNPDFVASSLSYLPIQDLIWTEYYHVGRAEVQSPLRYILTTEPLRWAYYLTIGSVLLFMFFEAKRKQRIIPVIKPLANTSLEFVTTIGNLYLQNGDHKDIAEKKIAFFLEQIRAKYWLNTQKITEEFLIALSARSGMPLEKVKEIFSLITNIQSRERISPDELTSLNTALDGFGKPGTSAASDNQPER